MAAPQKILRLSASNGHLIFRATAADFARQLCRTFCDMRCSMWVEQAVLEAFHQTQGWCQVSMENRYLIIGNPFRLDFAFLWQAVLVTLAECDRWPTEEQKRQRRLALQLKERDERAKQYRDQFKLIHGGSKYRET